MFCNDVLYLLFCKNLSANFVQICEVILQKFCGSNVQIHTVHYDAKHLKNDFLFAFFRAATIFKQEMRSGTRKNKKLDVKEVIGVCCKQEFSVMFANLQHGER